MRAGVTGEVVVVEDMELGDVFPGVGVVGRVDAVTPHPRGRRRGRRVLVLDTGLKHVHTDLQAVQSAAQEQTEVPAHDRAAMRIAGVIHIEFAFADALAVADVDVIGQLLVSEALRAGEPGSDAVRGHDAAMVLEFNEARAPEGGRDLLAVVKGGVVVPIGRMKPSKPHRRGIRELVADLRALQIDADGAVRADLEVQLEQSARTAAEPRRQEEIQLGNISALVLGKLGVVVADAHVRKTVHRHAEILGVLPGTRGHL